MELTSVSELIIAGGTLALAVATVYLGFETRRLASETNENTKRLDFQHQEGLTPIVKLSHGYGFSASGHDGGQFHQTVINRGTGPALKTTIIIELIEPGGEPRRIHEYQFGPLGAQEEMKIGRTFSGVGIPDKYVLTFRYENLFGAIGTTKYINGGGEPSVHYSRPPIIIRENDKGRFNTWAGTHRKA